jgi:hypothetical protein
MANTHGGTTSQELLDSLSRLSDLLREAANEAARCERRGADLKKLVGVDSDDLKLFARNAHDAYVDLP